MEENGSKGYKGVPGQNFMDNSKSNGKETRTCQLSQEQI